MIDRQFPGAALPVSLPMLPRDFGPAGQYVLEDGCVWF